MRIAARILALLIAAAALDGAAAEGRVALVIGNNTYKSAPLANPVNDAEDIAKALGAYGFKVTVKQNVGLREMRNAIRAFGEDLRRADVGLFFYAGHGLQIRGNNYLVPVDADIRNEADAEDLSIDTNYLLRTMEEAKAPMNVVILDACRDNPYARSFRSASRGLAQMSAATGSLIAFSTAPGSVAADGSGRNGTYTKNLLENLRHQDTDILKVFQRTRAAVIRETSGRQTPWESTSLIGDFHFRADQGVSVAAALPTSRPRAAVVPSVQDFMRDLDRYTKSEIAPAAEVRKLAEAGDVVARLRLCAMGTHERFNSSAPLEEGAAHCRKLAEEGVPLGVGLFARMHGTGRGVARNDAEAARLYRVGAEKGDTLSMNNLGSAYWQGTGVAQDYTESLRWYRRAAEQGEPSAMGNLANGYLRGLGVKQDFGEAARWARKSLDQDQTMWVPYFILGFLHHNGYGVAQDHSEAVRNYTKAVALGSVEAMTKLALLMLNGQGMPADPLRAAGMIREAADKGDSTAMWLLGNLYFQGTGVEKNLEEAFRWFKKGADLGDVDAIAQVGYSYFTGSGVKQDYYEAEKWLKNAAAKNNATAIYNLGLMYERGRGNLETSVDQAVVHYRRAAALGDSGIRKMAEDNLKRLGK